MNNCMMFFFFQAEDGIRDIGVTGVQTCALPIFQPRAAGRRSFLSSDRTVCPPPGGQERQSGRLRPHPAQSAPDAVVDRARSSDRKSVVSGKSVDLGGRRIIKKKNI